MTYTISKYGTTRHNYTSTTRGVSGIKYIVVHYTGGTGSAKNNCTYFSGGDRGASADFFIDDTSIWQYNDNPLKKYTWHCGDGHGKYGITNSNSVGIEVVSNGNEFSKAEKDRLAWLVQKLMKEYNVSASNVVRHYDASRKLCPLPYSGSDTKNAKWKTLHKTITGTSVEKKETATTFTPYKVKITAETLNVREDAGTKYKVITTVRKGEIFTIIKEKNGWGNLKSGRGWIYLMYTEKVK